MAATVTVTGKTGPGSTITAGVYTNVTNIGINASNNVLMLLINGEQPAREIDINAATTVTATKSGLTWTVTIS